MVFTESPDDQWLVTVAGKYRLTFNTADMTFDAEFLDNAPELLPSLYMIGEATAGGWSLDDATEIATDTENLYVWEGVLKEGTMKACVTKDFSAPFYRPASANCEISENGVADHTMVFTTDPDDQWKIVKAGKYRLTFNTADMTFNAEYLESAAVIAPLYMIGDATAGGWSLDDATELTPVDGVDGEYTWTGTLRLGRPMKVASNDPKGLFRAFLSPVGRRCGNIGKRRRSPRHGLYRRPRRQVESGERRQIPNHPQYQGHDHQGYRSERGI